MPELPAPAAAVAGSFFWGRNVHDIFSIGKALLLALCASTLAATAAGGACVRCGIVTLECGDCGALSRDI